MNWNRILGGSLACAALLTVAAVQDSNAQLLNGSFEMPDASGGDQPCSADWACFSGTEFTTTALASDGTQSFKTFGPFNPGGGAGAAQRVAAAEGETWVGEIYAQNASFDPIDDQDFGVIKIEFLDSAGNLAAGGVLGVDVFESNPINGATPMDTWTLLGVGTAPAPAGTAFAQFVIVKVDVDGTQGGSIFWDDAVLFIDEPSPTVETSWGEVKSVFR